MEDDRACEIVEKASAAGKHLAAIEFTDTMMALPKNKQVRCGGCDFLVTPGRAECQWCETAVQSDAESSIPSLLTPQATPMSETVEDNANPATENAFVGTGVSETRPPTMPSIDKGSSSDASSEFVGGRDLVILNHPLTEEEMGDKNDNQLSPEQRVIINDAQQKHSVAKANADEANSIYSLLLMKQRAAYESAINADLTIDSTTGRLHRCLSCGKHGLDFVNDVAYMQEFKDNFIQPHWPLQPCNLASDAKATDQSRSLREQIADFCKNPICFRCELCGLCKRAVDDEDNPVNIAVGTLRQHLGRSIVDNLQNPGTGTDTESSPIWCGSDSDNANGSPKIDEVDAASMRDSVRIRDALECDECTTTAVSRVVAWE